MLEQVAGARFDPGFAPDYWLGFYGGGGPDFGSPYRLWAYRAVLPATAPDTTSVLGMVQPVNAGALTGGTNPWGVELAVDNSNRAGVGKGCAASSGAGVTSGIEMSIPLAAIGNPTGPVRVCAFLYYSNQALGPIVPGMCSLTESGPIDFAAIAGQQYFVVPADNSSVPPTATDRMILLATPSRAAGLTVSYSLPTPDPAAIAVLDAAGRRVLSRAVPPASSLHTLQLAAPGALPAGVYFLRLVQGSRVATARSVVVP